MAIRATPIDGDTEQIYAIYAKHLDRNQLLGYCYSESWEDIEAYYEDKKAYGIEVEAVRPVRIPKGYADRKALLVKERESLQKQIAELDRRIAASK